METPLPANLAEVSSNVNDVERYRGYWSIIRRGYKPSPNQLVFAAFCEIMSEDEISRLAEETDERSVPALLAALTMEKMQDLIVSAEVDNG